LLTAGKKEGDTSLLDVPKLAQYKTSKAEQNFYNELNETYFGKLKEKTSSVRFEEKREKGRRG
jgi:hypothetical protein